VDRIDCRSMTAVTASRVGDQGSGGSRRGAGRSLLPHLAPVGYGQACAGERRSAWMEERRPRARVRDDPPDAHRRRDSKDDAPVWSDPKTVKGQNRTIDLDAGTVAGCVHYVRSRLRQRLRFRPGLSRRDCFFVLLPVHRQPYHPERISRSFPRAREAARAARIPQHSLRNTWADTRAEGRRCNPRSFRSGLATPHQHHTRHLQPRDRSMQTRRPPSWLRP